MEVMKKRISYIVSILFFIVTLLINLYHEVIFGSFNTVPLGQVFVRFNAFLISAIPFTIGIILLIFSFIQKENNNDTSKNISSLYVSLNPVVSLTIGLLILLMVYFKVIEENTINFFASIGGGLIFAFGLGGFIQRLFKKH